MKKEHDILENMWYPIKFIIKSATLSLLTICFLISCRKYNDPMGCKDCPIANDECSCHNVKKPKDAITEGARYITGAPQSYDPNGSLIKMPRFNPSNPNQVTFYETKFENGNTVSNGFFFYDRTTQKKASMEDLYGLTTDNNAYTWDFEGNLYFSSYSNEAKGGGIFKFNTKTSEITTKYYKGGDVNEVVWIETLKRVGFRWATGATGGVHYLLYSFDEDNTDTFPEYYSSPEGSIFPTDVQWSKDLYLYTNKGSKTKLKYYNTQTDEYGILASNYQFNNWSGGDNGIKYKWHPLENTLYVAIKEKGVYSVRLYHNNVVRIKKSCDNWQYADIDISGGGKEILVVRSHEQNVDLPSWAPKRFNSWIYIDDQLYVMDIDGCNERPLFE